MENNSSEKTHKRKNVHKQNAETTEEQRSPGKFLNASERSIIDDETSVQAEHSKERDNKPKDHFRTIPALVDPIRGNVLYCILLFTLTVTSLITRLYNIENPPHVCWDETHFGKMGSWYIKRTFFFDVHPPLGKMLIGLAGYLTGYDGEFPFSKPGDEYGETRYVGMRVFCALLGAALVPLAYMSTWLLSRSLTASLIAGTLVLFDTGTLTLSRHILLDPILMFFIMAATYSLLKFLSYKDRSFSLVWWFWLSATGVFLAASIGVKFVGLFVILLAGYTTVEDLWQLLGDQKLTLAVIFKHFLARAICLIILPAVCYLFFFAIHFKVLSNSGSGDGFYSSAFQSQLIGNKLYNVSMPEYIAYGSLLTLKQRRTGGAYLHSHWHLYPEEFPPRQQQVTTYSHKDENNVWRMKQATEEPDVTGYPHLVKNGDLIRLEHITTKRNLHSHHEPAPITKRHFQVSGYGTDGMGDANDVWQIEIVGAPHGSPIQTVRSKLRLIHYHVKCALFSHDKKLPKWGWEQLEVTCNPNVKDNRVFWSVEEVIDPRLPNVSFEVYLPSLMEKFVESHAVMTQGNSGLKPREGEVTSRPWQWPIDFRGQIFSGKEFRIYLLGNPVIFWSILIIFGMYFLVIGINAVRQQRGVQRSQELREFDQRMMGAAWWFLIAWALHYLPFWPMTRVLYFHHYFPAFLYSAMFAGVVLDYVIIKLSLGVPKGLAISFYHWCVGVIVSGSSYSFYIFHPMTYGMAGPLAADENSMMHRLKWLDSWDI
ncbi:hypothetical protein CHS0354_032436 [Potamilus streckersoni]|uniref:Protein O-mannosyl-transferase 2 n=1 Tax=Potamilus streckersoni TaxID=2493646 RepID=A0AAE0SQW2_9BIVA|nr:hypothetical protein CHS0354_032436 [Potamilus streckersoni]